ncbi:MAG: sulfite exporter TauE/SafE family protein [Rothia sp. (in: high G+C Gram-positive bacteria)]|uniref:sulfite exporter TauE/SafE family protein n=1 Tax=Rothia sp. (in: high G+C Gram-positive bacteria) TaxID=1885016 RepID=UPI00270482D3|nr:sulfite exporter TauE/SafE family protein [Rothia sp. (in: high G+C Gram-positive bacteria)]
MNKLLLIALGGLLAQLVDGSLGMGFGATSTTLLLALAAMNPASASAVVHVAELGTTLASGVSHWRFNNIDWKVVLRLGLPGAVGAFAGATLLSNLSLATAEPVMATILTLIGINLVLRFSTGRRTSRGTGAPATPRTLGFLGLFGGFVDAAGGGGWGPVTSSTLMSIGKTEPRRIVGTVNTAEFLVTLAASLGFVLGMWQDLTEHLLAVLALLAGGVLAAPVAAWLVTRINPTALGGFVGTCLVVTHLPYLIGLFPALAPYSLPLTLATALTGLALSTRGVLQSRQLIPHRPTGYQETVSPSLHTLATSTTRTKD